MCRRAGSSSGMCLRSTRSASSHCDAPSITHRPCFSRCYMEWWWGCKKIATDIHRRRARDSLHCRRARTEQIRGGVCGRVSCTLRRVDAKIRKEVLPVVPRRLSGCSWHPCSTHTQSSRLRIVASRLAGLTKTTARGVIEPTGSLLRNRRNVQRPHALRPRRLDIRAGHPAPHARASPLRE